MADILVIDDQDRTLDLCRSAIPEHRYRGPARHVEEALDLLAKGRGRIDLVLLDVHFDIEPTALVGYVDGLSAAELENLKRRQGLLILERVRQAHPDLPVIVMTSRDELSLEAELPVDEDFTYFVDDDGVDARSLSAQIASLVASRHAALSTGPVYWGRSLAMKRIRHRLSVLAQGRLPVILLGAMGTGKSLIARHFVHALSARRGTFVAVDLSTVPSELVAAHLFGSVRGAYTGATTDRVGAFELAHQGTLFLDEVGNLSMASQKMLLTVLQDGFLHRVGDLKERQVDVKLVVATNEDLRARVADGTFRADLYMRLNPAAAIELPGLAERGHDLGLLLDFSLRDALQRPYLRGLVDEYRKAVGLSRGEVRIVSEAEVPPADDQALIILFPERTMRLLKRHTWPGNLREFAMTVENAVLFALAEMSTARPAGRVDVVTVRPKLVRDLLSVVVPATGTAPATGILLEIQPEDTLNKVSVQCERTYFTALYLKHAGDFSLMAVDLLGDAEHGRKVQLRFNQLGLKVRELKERLP